MQRSKGKKTRSVKKIKISAKKAAILSISLLGICALMLFASITFSKDSKEKESVQKIVDSKDKNESNNVEENKEVLPVQSKKIESKSFTDEKVVVESKELEKPLEPVQHQEKIIEKKEVNKTTVAKKNPVTVQPQKKATVKQEPKKNEPIKETKKKPLNGKKIILILDDGGHNISQLKPFLNLEFPLTVAVLPGLAHSKEAASLVRKANKELMLHQPMQAIDLKINPGEKSIQPNMTKEEIVQTLMDNINEISPIKGMNNHEGSLITADKEKMDIILQVCKDQKIYFVDSRTNSESKVVLSSKDVGIHIEERDVFLDNTPDRSNMLKEFQKGIKIADRDGIVIMIGHIWSSTNLSSFLDEMYKKYSAEGYEFTTVSAMQSGR